MNIWEMYPHLARVVRDDHLKGGMESTGHNFDHSLRAGQYALLIAPDRETGRLAGAAGLCHSADRILQKQLEVGRKDVSPAAAERVVRRWLGAYPFTPGDLEVILDAILKHSGKNQPDDSPVLVTLKDADRLTCLDAENVMTAAQFFSDLPPLDPVLLLDDPGATFREPRSVLRNFVHILEWGEEQGPSSFRLPKARELARRRLRFIRSYIDAVIDQRREIGLVPYPIAGG
ncbi:MAG: HD domain-containing protein [Candidatus Sungbacteria bacterium]|nr:HD domain-containing protein [Candidatus Sungbacteria bacterium]